jgi:methionyl-tRNA formyltransferase
MRLIFMGSPDFSIAPLADLLGAGHEVVAIYCQPPRRSGRGQSQNHVPVHVYADEKGIPVHTPESLKDADAQKVFSEIDADVAVVAAYGLILPPQILAAPRFGCINIHASLLPRWRGAAPIQRAIMAGDEATGITIMKMDKGLDTGAILLSEEIPITSDMDAQKLHDALSEMGARLIITALGFLEDGTLASHPQPSEGVTYADKITSSENQLNWQRPAAETGRIVRALAPRCWFEYDGERIRVISAEVIDDGALSETPGLVLDDHLMIACATGALRPLRLQRAGKAALDAVDFLRGCPIPKGTVF